MQRHVFSCDQSQTRMKSPHIHRDPKLDTEWSNRVAETLARVAAIKRDPRHFPQEQLSNWRHS
jgi:hypothetical protein